MLVGGALLLNILLGYYLYDVMITKATVENEQKFIQQELSIGAKPVEKYLTEYQEKLNQLSHHPAIIQALNEKNNDALNDLEKTLVSSIENAIDLKILVAGNVDVDPDGVVPIRFAELDLLRRAERGEKAYAEAALINEKWQIHFVARVTAGQDLPLIGTLMLTLDGEPLKKILQASTSNLGEKKLEQKFANSPTLTIFKTGTGGLSQSRSLAIPNSNWEVSFTGSNLLLEQAEEAPTLWMLALGCTTAFSLFLALVLSRFLVKVEQEAEQKLAPTIAEVAKKATASVADATPSTLFQKQDILDIAVIDEDENILGLNDIRNKKQFVTPTAIDEASVPAHIFRSYDIRGVVGKDLDASLAEKIGHAVGSEALDKGEQSLIVARDGRTHSQDLTNALIKGILRSGCNVMNIGVVPTPLMYFATYHFSDVRSGVMVTASHNPAEYNGFKVVINNNALADDAVTGLRTRILAQNFHQGIGEESFREIIPHYIERIFSDVALAGDVSIVIDAGNAVTGIVAPQLFEELGCRVTPLYCDLDGTFPNHDPDPTQESNLFALIEKVKEVNADIGVAFDGDGDRLVVVTPKGDIIWPDRLLMLFAKDILARHPGADVLFDVKCSRQLNQVISGYGGRPIMWKTGHSPMKAKMVETGALIGGEYSGHIFIKDRWYGFDDGIYAMARLLEIITLRDQNIDDIFSAFPQLIITPEIKIAVPDSVKFDVIKKLTESGDFQNGNVTSIDGVRVDYSKGWGLVRASNTSPALTLRFEAESQEALVSIQQIFKRELLKVDSSLALKF
ncbi:MAG: phosphomannomutase/phosphoglucomutase [Gammaproteobacteria bacterium]|nr:MAG: phosphomannomutase/phosphoglucomutase [Gammaproteobacteria bacterium]